MPAVSVPASLLRAKTLPEITSKCVRVFQGGNDTAYNVCSDVLFDFDKADDPAGRRRRAAPGRGLAQEALRAGATSRSTGTPTRRARTPTTTACRSAAPRPSSSGWPGHGIAASRISTHGYGVPTRRCCPSATGLASRLRPALRDRRRARGDAQGLQPRHRRPGLVLRPRRSRASTGSRATWARAAAARKCCEAAGKVARSARPYTLFLEPLYVIVLVKWHSWGGTWCAVRGC